ncbi:unnamed protein product [Acanthoscelides obtectus]|uniref:Uncharacterized protein n=1 Tax=Acanthoscelides obtectus TaxID=200917 RepID=A0A9P0JJA9_ACAOB|nr:unnamed protein product [Acanthoscelides obtectus]CAK1654284.1 hypothetical protein AOBTE_LOCUS18506 [Acanthoscelides obtectus]
MRSASPNARSRSGSRTGG